MIDRVFETLDKRFFAVDFLLCCIASSACGRNHSSICIVNFKLNTAKDRERMCILLLCN